MTIRQSLKQKNKLVQELKELNLRLQTNNSVIEGNSRDYSAKETLNAIYDKVNELSGLKTKIHRANTPVYDKIFLLSELKSVAQTLRALDCTNGIAVDFFARRSESQIVKNSEITTIERDTEIKNLESRIEQIQDELDQFNSVTVLS
jgi:DNA repair ATPase RecN